MPTVCQEVYQELEIQEWALPLWSSQSSAKELIKKIQRSLRYCHVIEAHGGPDLLCVVGKGVQQK